MVRTPAVRSLPLLVGSLLLSSCSDDDGIQRLPFEPASSTGRLVVTPSIVTLAWIGAEAGLTAGIATAQGGTVSGLTLTWRSLNPGVATVDAQGTVRAVAEGDARVVASVVNLADTAEVTVRRLPARVELAPDSLLFTALDTAATLDATVFDGGGQPLPSAAVAWSSSDTSVARVDATGVVTPLVQGVATVEARAGTVRGTARVRVAVGPASVAVTPASLAFDALGDTVRLAATVVDARGEALPGVAVTFQVTDTAVATVTEDGLVTARGPGSTAVTASGDTVARAVPVTVTQTPASASVTPDSVTLTPGGEQAFSAAVADRNGNPISDPPLAWSSSDTSVVEVSASGVATARASGSAVVTVTSDTVSAEAAVTVLDVPVDSVDVTPDSLELEAGAQGTLTARAFAADGTELSGAPVAWTSRDPAVALVTQAGAVTAVAQGATWVVAEAGAGRDSARVSVSPPAGLYDVVVQFVGDPPTAAQQAAFQAAETRWESAIVGDLPDDPVDLAAGACGIDHPALSATVDDVHVFAEVAEIDSVGGTLAQAGPCVIRTSGGLAVVGVMRFDVADLEDLEAEGLLQATVVHEMAHVLGLGGGAPWDGILVGKGGDDPFWPGTRALSEFVAAGGTTPNAVPVENSGGQGTRDAHWRESVLGRELMTGFINVGVVNALSAITIAAIGDMGYAVDQTGADPYTVEAALRAGPARARALVDDVLPPRFFVDRSGRMRPLGAR